MRTKKRTATLKSEIAFGVAGHAAMGVALGLVFAFVVTHVRYFGVDELIGYSNAPKTTMAMFVGVAMIMFGIGATLTGLVLMEDS
jgi:ABC-type multidrug transport system permease subunit